MGDVRRPLPRPRCRGGGHSTGMAGRSNHAAAQSRLTEHGARRCQQQAGCVGAPRRASTERGARVARSGRPSRLGRRYPRPTVGVWAITQYRKMQREGLRGSAWPNIYFGSKHNSCKECTTGNWPGPARRRGRGERDVYKAANRLLQDRLLDKGMSAHHGTHKRVGGLQPGRARSSVPLGVTGRRDNKMHGTWRWPAKPGCAYAMPECRGLPGSWWRPGLPGAQVVAQLPIGGGQIGGWLANARPPQGDGKKWRRWQERGRGGAHPTGGRRQHCCRPHPVAGRGGRDRARGARRGAHAGTLTGLGRVSEMDFSVESTGFFPQKLQSKL